MNMWNRNWQIWSISVSHIPSTGSAKRDMDFPPFFIFGFASSVTNGDSARGRFREFFTVTGLTRGLFFLDPPRLLLGVALLDFFFPEII